MRKILIGVTLAAVIVLLAILPTAATDVTITATPSFISFSSGPTTWTLNDITGSGVIVVDTIYYSNPLGDTTPPSATVVDGECQFTWVNDSSVNIDVFVDCGSFTGGDADATNSGTGDNGATTYGAHSWYSGMTYTSKVIVLASGSSALYQTSTPGEDKLWGAEIETRTDAWTGGSSSTATMTITAAEA